MLKQVANDINGNSWCIQNGEKDIFQWICVASETT